MQLHELKLGKKAKILGYSSGQNPYKNRLIAMGLIPGTEFCISRIAPLGDPIQISVRGCTLGLRKHEASIVQVEELRE